jgi:hypothetical protein
MISTRFGVLAALAVLPAFAQVADLSAAKQPAPVRAARRQLGPIHNMLDHLDGTVDSDNWSGYAVTGSSFTSATASWVVPAAVCSGVSGDEYTALWVGLDGYSSSTVEQTGTISDCAGTTPGYYAWFEFYPSIMYEVTTVPVVPGNVMSASVSYSGGVFTLKITNVTTGKSYSITSTAAVAASEAPATVAAAARASAEWIVEAPCCASTGQYVPLADFGTATFGADYTKQAGTDDATEPAHSGTTGSFGSARIQQLRKVATTSSPQTSTCAALSSDGTSFSCTWAK